MLMKMTSCLAFTNSIATSGTKHATCTNSPRQCPSHPIASTTSSSLSMSNAADLHTGYEWLARDKIDAYCDEMSATDELKWMDIETGQTGDSVDPRYKTGGGTDDSDSVYVEMIDPIMQLPLYPLPAVHLPTPGQIHTLNNVEPRNIRMANDLIDPDKGSGFDGRFCVTLRASDTGRIAQTATLMRLVNVTRQESFDGSLLAIRVECVAEGLVEVQQIINPNCWSKEQRIKKSDEYLVANVRPMGEDNMRKGDDDILVVQAIAEKAAHDFDFVRRVYSSKDGISTNELPEWAIDAVRSNLPSLSARDFVDSFWQCAEHWQQLSNTIRMVIRSELNSDVNEITIDEACKLGGPLKLPVHRSELPIDVQKRLNGMEEAAAQNFIELGNDPIVSFQIILSMKNGLDRLNYLALLISRERQRLEAKNRLQQVFEVGADDATRPMMSSNITSSFD